MNVLTKPMILVTVEQCAKYLHSFKGVSLDWYINGTYTLPMAIYIQIVVITQMMRDTYITL